MRKFVWALAILMLLGPFILMEYVKHIDRGNDERLEAVTIAKILNSSLASLEALRKSHVKELLESLQSADPSLEPSQVENYYHYAELASFHEYLRIWILEASIDEKKLSNRRYDVAQALAVSEISLGWLFMLANDPSPLGEFLESNPSLSPDQQRTFDNFQELKNKALRESVFWIKRFAEYREMYFDDSKEATDEDLHPELRQLQIALGDYKKDVKAFIECYDDYIPASFDEDFGVNDLVVLFRMMYVVQKQRVRIAEPISNPLNFEVLNTATPSFSPRQFLRRTLDNAHELAQGPSSEFPDLARIEDAKASSLIIADYMEQMNACLLRGKELFARYLVVLTSHLADKKPQSH